MVCQSVPLHSGPSPPYPVARYAKARARVVGHDPNRWREFHKRYFEKLRANHAVVEHLTDLVSTGKVTLLFGARDTERNNAVALADFLAAH
jgi:uncharacterized protein YeaO (DUF488 family)